MPLTDIGQAVSAPPRLVTSDSPRLLPAPPVGPSFEATLSPSLPPAPPLSKSSSHNPSHSKGHTKSVQPIRAREESSPQSSPGPPRSSEPDVASVGGISVASASMAHKNSPIKSGTIPTPTDPGQILHAAKLRRSSLEAVPNAVLGMCAEQPPKDSEFTHVRYSAVTCGPDDFKDNFTLRQVELRPARVTELFIVITMFNEDVKLFCQTMHSVMKNIAYLCRREEGPREMWGPESWKKVVVCIVSDGRQEIDPRTLYALTLMGVYLDMDNFPDHSKKPVTAHIYEYTTQISVTPSMKLEGAERGIMPVQIIFCLKENNEKKINSHRWFFNAFGPILNPTVCVLLDVGTIPGPMSIYHLWKAFSNNNQVGGACGEIIALKGKYMRNLINPLVAAQNFEYKMSNILDKPLESIFGYITVLPGAFSAYRYEAVQNNPNGEGPLQKYFLGEEQYGANGAAQADRSMFRANMYLAEDRILCWEIVSRRDKKWLLHYIQSAYAVTDVPKEVPELISQRRRWSNGSFFGALHSIICFYYIYRSSHSWLRKFWFHIELVYQCFNLVFSWFALGIYYISFSILSESLEDPSFNLGRSVHRLNVIFNYLYLGLLIVCIVLALGNRPQGARWGYTMALIGFGAITVYMTAAAIYITIKEIAQVVKDDRPFRLSTLFANSIFRNIVIPLLATLGLYCLASLICFEPWHMVTSLIQYLLIAPSYVSVLSVYAFANVHDVSWGTKARDEKTTPTEDSPGQPKTNLHTHETKATSSTEKKKDVSSNPTASEVPAAAKDLEYDAAVEGLPGRNKAYLDTDAKKNDRPRKFRSQVLLSWMLTNALLAAITISATGKAADKGVHNTVNGFLGFILYSLAGLALFRFVGLLVYMLVRILPRK